MERRLALPGGRAPRALLIPAGLIPSTHIRVLEPFEILSREGLVDPLLVLDSDLGAVDVHSLIAGADVVVVQRSTTAGACAVADLAHAAGTPVVFECDDDFLAIPTTIPGVGEYYNRPDTQAYFKYMLKEAEVVTVGTPSLAKKLASHGARTRILTNCVDFGIVGEGRRAELQDAVLIGYAGTVDHNPDFEPVWPALRRLMKEYGELLQLQFFGLVPRELAGSPNVTHVPWTDDYPGFLSTLARVPWSFALAPLADRPHNRAKTNNKYREYGACRIPAVYSEINVYSSCVQDGVNGLLVKHNEQGWYKGMKRMIEDPELRRGIAEAARADVWERYRMERCAADWYGVLSDLLATDLVAEGA